MSDDTLRQTGADKTARNPIKVIPIEPLNEVPLDAAKTMDCLGSPVRHPRETKGARYDLTLHSDGDCCGPDSDCC